MTGAALLATLLVTLIASLLMTTFVTVAVTDSMLQNNVQDAELLQLAVESGLNRAAQELTVSGLTPGGVLARSAGADGLVDGSTNLAALLATDDNPWFPALPAVRVSGDPIVQPDGGASGRLWLFIRNNIGDGGAGAVDMDGVVELFAVARRGGVQRQLRAEASRQCWPEPAAVLALGGPVGTYGAPPAGQVRVDGTDLAGVRGWQPATLVDSSADAALLAAHGPSVLAFDRLDRRLSRIRWLDALDRRVERMATRKIVPPPGVAATLPPVGSAGAFEVVVVDGDAELHDTGYGLLLVRGRLRLTGAFRWTGLILVIGQGQWEWSGDGHIEGHVFLARTRDADGTLRPAPGPVGLEWSTGARGTLLGNSAALDSVCAAFPYGLSGYRE